MQDTAIYWYMLQIIMKRADSDKNLTAFVRHSISASVWVGKVNMASGSSHDVLDTVASLTNDVRVLGVTDFHLQRHMQ